MDIGILKRQDRILKAVGDEFKLKKRGVRDSSGKSVLEDYKPCDKWKKDPESGIMKTIIDDLTPYLVDRKIREVLETAVSRFLVPKTGFNTCSKWNFNWYEESMKANRVIYALTLVGDSKVQGLISLVDKEKDNFISIPLLEASPSNIGREGKFIGTGEHLIAIAIKESFTRGYGGYVLIEAKTTKKVLESYLKYGGKRVGRSNKVHFYGDASKRLYETYFGGNKK